MIKTFNHNWLIIAISVIISAGIWMFSLNKQHSRKIQYTARVFHSSNGWGYDILVDNKLFIRQESIPTLPGKKGFANKEQAEQAAHLIINKMDRGEFPTVTTFEIERIVH